MQVDAAQVLGLVIRQVRNFEKDGRPASTVVLTRLYDTSVNDLWEALTDKERIPRWFLPIEGELRLGGRYQLTGNAGGTVTACSPPNHFAATWEFGGSVTWIDVTVAADGDKARMTLEHTAIIEDHWNQFGPGAVGIGWDLGVTGLERYLATGTPVDQAAAHAWMASPNGKDFISVSGEAWRAAHVASGADPASAKARSDRTIAFYRGEAPPDVAHPGAGKLMQAFDVLSDPVRRRILELLASGEMASGEVVAAIGSEFGISQAAVSQHLKVLRDGGFAQVRADAQRRLYSVDPAGLQAVDAWLGRFRGFWEPRMDALATEIARGKRQRRQAPLAGRRGERA